jgi:hypothetical protein
MGAFPVPNGAATVTAEVTIGADKYCMTFTGTGDGSKFLVKDASTGTCAPTVPTCGNNVREGGGAVRRLGRHRLSGIVPAGFL